MAEKLVAEMDVAESAVSEVMAMLVSVEVGVAEAEAAETEEGAEARVAGGAGVGIGRPGGASKVWVNYEAHMPTLYLKDRYNLCTILTVTVLPTVQGHVLCNNCHLCKL